MPQVSSNIYWQEKSEPIVKLIYDARIHSERISKEFTYIHIVNLYAQEEHNTLDCVQLQTIVTMENAKKSVMLNTKNVAVDFVSVQEVEDRDLVPATFSDAIDLNRNITFVEGFDGDRKFPLMFDLIKNGNMTYISSEYVIFTNSDICLMPYFYSVISTILSHGFDSIIIHRRTVEGVPQDDAIPLAVADMGFSHPGLDCFIFPRKWINGFVYNNACVGSGLVMRGLLLNLVARAESLVVLTEAHLTYHFGDDRPWNSPEMKKYEEHNKKEMHAVYEGLKTNKRYNEKLNDFFDKLPKYRP